MGHYHYHDDDEQKHLHLQAVKQHVLLRRAFKFGISVSLFALLILFSSSSGLLPKHFSSYSNTRLLSFLVHTLERKYMFLICNGILAILAKTTPTSSPPSTCTDSALCVQLSTPAFPSVIDEEEEGPDEGDASKAPAAELQEDKHEEEEDEEEGIAEEDVQGEFDPFSRRDKKEGREEVAAAEDLASTEEFNRRVEEFIRRMKEEIRIEADRPQLIAV